MDYRHNPSGVVIHNYGPHFFRTSNVDVWDFVNRFSSFYKYEAYVMACIGKKYYPWPPHVHDFTIPQAIYEPRNFEEACLAKMPREIYRDFVYGYTRKQWGCSPSLLEPELADRIEIRKGNGESRLKTSKFQGIPELGYSMMMENMVQDIPIILDTDYSSVKGDIEVKNKIIYTGPIDEYYGYEYGRLKYVRQKRFIIHKPEVYEYQPYPVVNFPQTEKLHIRSIEWKKLMKDDDGVQGTVVTKEVPMISNDPDTHEYPFPSKRELDLYNKYKRLSYSDDKMIFCGRLGSYRYLDMDAAIEAAFEIGRSILKKGELNLC